MFWLLFLIVVVAGLASPTTGVAAAAFCVAAYLVSPFASKRRISPFRIGLLVLSPLVGLVAGGVIFLLGPGF